MENIMNAVSQFDLISPLLEHIGVSLAAALAASLVAVPLAWLTHRVPGAAKAQRAVLSVLYSLPTVGAAGVALGLLAPAQPGFAGIPSALWALLAEDPPG